MNPSNAGAQLFLAETEIPDPGASGTIAPNVSLGVCNLVSATTETRTLGRPVKQGVVFTLHMRTDAGDITLTVTGGYDEAATTSYVFSDPGQFLTLMSFYDGTNYYWRAIADHNTGSSQSGSPTFTSITMADNGAINTNSTNGTRVGATNTQKVSLWGATPIVQPSGTGELVGILGFADNSDNATNMNSNGNVGTKRYTFNDIVKALKNTGILAAS